MQLIKATPVNTRHSNLRNHSSINEAGSELAVDPVVNNSKDSSGDDGLTVFIATRENISSAHVKKNHPTSSIIGEIQSGIMTYKKELRDYSKMIAKVCYIASIEPTNIIEALKDKH